jgi:HTH-type transcriptional regulator/antitoxin HigA
MTKDLERIAAIWPSVKDTLSTPHTERDYRRARGVLGLLTDEVGEDEQHALASLMETVGNLVSAYETEHDREPPAGPIEGLRYLMEEHGLRQSDLRELGTQGVVSEILAGKRTLNLRQIRALSARFAVSPAVFISTEQPRRGGRADDRKRKRNG